jgi:hypothetical protein
MKKDEYLNEFYKALIGYILASFIYRVSQKLSDEDLRLFLLLYEKIISEVLKRMEEKNFNEMNISDELEALLKEISLKMPQFSKYFEEAFEETKNDINQKIVEFLKQEQK